jgi:hypothetical protein
MPIDRKKFFERWRTEMVRYMTLVEILPEGYLYYYDVRDTCIWVVVGPHEVIVAYNRFENPSEIREKVHIWKQAFSNRVSLDSSSICWLSVRFDGQPLYGAEENPDGGPPLAMWMRNGDGLGLVPNNPRRPLPVLWDLLPPDWPESYRDRIRELAQTRVDRPDATGPRSTIFT